MNERPSLLAIFAHPDDESILAGGTIAHHVALGWRAALICATRGEWGPISDETLADRETLGQVREQELRQACQILGIEWLHFLDLPDGAIAHMAGTEEEEHALEKIVLSIRELRPWIVITFGQDGMYGHQDHIAIGDLATRACAMASDPNAFARQLTDRLTEYLVPELYYATVPHGLYPKLISQLAEYGLDAHVWGIPPEQFGVPPAEISMKFDITPFLGRKFTALRCHRTQLDDSHAMARLSPELAISLFNFEYFQVIKNHSFSNFLQTD